LLDKNIKLLLQREYLTIRDAREVFKLSGLNPDINQIFELLDQSNRLYIKANQWTDKPISMFKFRCLQDDDEWEYLRLDKVMDCDFIRLDSYQRYSYKKENKNDDFNFVFSVDKLWVNDKYPAEYPRLDETGFNYFSVNEELAINVVTYDGLANNFYTKSDFIKQYLSNCNNTTTADNTNKNTNKDTDYKYSEVLKRYNDIILSFANSDEYKRYGKNMTKEAIKTWLSDNHKEYIRNDKFKAVFADLVFDEYEIIPKTGIYANRKRTL
jgi:hypothetical protein